MIEESTKEEIRSWVGKSLKSEDIEKYAVNVTGTTEKGDGYVADIYFVEVIGKTASNEDKTIDLVVKAGKKGTKMRETYSMTEVYERELYMYDVLFPRFKKFQEDKKILDPFDAIPKCYKSLYLEDTEVLVLENLKKNGYQLHDRQQPMTVAHMKLILKNYAKFHGISFALRDQQRAEFDKLTHNFTSFRKKLMAMEDMKMFMKMSIDKNAKLLKGTENDLDEKMLQILERGADVIINELYEDIPEEVVVLHEDGWCNNFMFKHENGSKYPTEVIIIDWQIATVHSPMLDLAYFLYLASSHKQTAHWEELLKFYYDNLKEFVEDLGSDIEKLFPFSKMMEHWKRYSIMGFIIAVTALEFMMCAKEDVISFEDIEDGQDMVEKMKQVRPKDSDMYKERLSAAVQYCWNMRSMDFKNETSRFR